MKFHIDNYPQQPTRNSNLTDTVADEHQKHFVTVAEEQIRATHHHQDGSSVELHEVGAKEFISQSIASSLEGKLTGSGFGSGSSDDEKQFWQKQNDLASAKIEYEKKSPQNQPTQMYGAQQSVTGGVSHSQETAMVGCNCGLEWTVTGQSMKAQGAEAVKIEQYGPAAGKSASGYNASAGSGSGGPGEYHTGGGQQQDYKG